MKVIKEKGEERFMRKVIDNMFEIIIDTKTGVQYLSHSAVHSGWAMALLDKDGKPLIDNSYKIEEKE